MPKPAQVRRMPRDDRARYLVSFLGQRVRVTYMGGTGESDEVFTVDGRAIALTTMPNSTRLAEQIVIQRPTMLFDFGISAHSILAVDVLPES